MPHSPNLIVKAGRQAQKAIERGDVDNALKWFFLIDRQVEVIALLAAIDENDPRLKRYRPVLVDLRAAMKAISEMKTPRKLAGGGG